MSDTPKDPGLIREITLDGQPILGYRPPGDRLRFFAEGPLPLHTVKTRRAHTSLEYNEAGQPIRLVIALDLDPA